MNLKYKISYFLNTETDEYTHSSDKSSHTDVDVCSKTNLPTDKSITQSKKPETDRLKMELCYWEFLPDFSA